MARIRVQRHCLLRRARLQELSICTIAGLTVRRSRGSLHSEVRLPQHSFDRFRSGYRSTPCARSRLRGGLHGGNSQATVKAAK